MKYRSIKKIGQSKNRLHRSKQLCTTTAPKWPSETVTWFVDCVRHFAITCWPFQTFWPLDRCY